MADFIPPPPPPAKASVSSDPPADGHADRPAANATSNATSAGAAAAQASTSTESAPDDNTITLNKREMRLGLRHRDSFAVHKSHLHHEHGIGPLGTTGPGKAARPQSTLTDLMTKIPPSPQRDGEDGLDEGGPDDNITVNPDQEAEIMKALEALDNMALSSGASDGSPESMAQAEEATRKRNKLKSMIKGVGSALGLRKSKKKRLAEAAAAAGAGKSGQSANDGGVPTGDPSAPAGSADGDDGAERKSLLKRMFRSRSSPALDVDDSKLGSPRAGSNSRLAGSPTPSSHHHAFGQALPGHQTPGSIAGHASAVPGLQLPASAQQGDRSSLETAATPLRDENGLFVPRHRQLDRIYGSETPVRSALKGSPSAAGSARRALTPGFESVSSTASNSTADPTTARGNAPMSPGGVFGPNGKRRICFVDQVQYPAGGMPPQQQPLEDVYFCEDLHYSENAEHEDWEDDEGDGKCAIM